jgi:hypothetical protein
VYFPSTSVCCDMVGVMESIVVFGDDTTGVFGQIQSATGQLGYSKDASFLELAGHVQRLSKKYVALHSSDLLSSDTDE